MDSFRVYLDLHGNAGKSEKSQHQDVDSDGIAKMVLDRMIFTLEIVEALSSELRVLDGQGLAANKPESTKKGRTLKSALNLGRFFEHDFIETFNQELDFFLFGENPKISEKKKSVQKVDKDPLEIHGELMQDGVKNLKFPEIAENRNLFANIENTKLLANMGGFLDKLKLDNLLNPADNTALISSREIENISDEIECQTAGTSSVNDEEREEITKFRLFARKDINQKRIAIKRRKIKIRIRVKTKLVDKGESEVESQTTEFSQKNGSPSPIKASEALFNSKSPIDHRHSGDSQIAIGELVERIFEVIGLARKQDHLNTRLPEEEPLQQEPETSLYEHDSASAALVSFNDGGDNWRRDAIKSYENTTNSHYFLNYSPDLQSPCSTTSQITDYSYFYCDFWSLIPTPFKIASFSICDEHIVIFPEIATQKRRKLIRPYYRIIDVQVLRSKAQHLSDWIQLKTEASAIALNESGNLLWRVSNGVAYAPSTYPSADFKPLSLPKMTQMKYWLEQTSSIYEGQVISVSLTKKHAWYLTEKGVFVSMFLPEMGIIFRAECDFRLCQLVASDYAVWALRPEGDLVVRVGIKDTQCPMGESWAEDQSIPIKLVGISLCGNSGFGLDQEGNIWRKNNLSEENPFGSDHWIKVCSIMDDYTLIEAIGPYTNSKTNVISNWKIRASGMGIFVSIGSALLFKTF